jgi:hypothetical protein
MFIFPVCLSYILAGGEKYECAGIFIKLTKDVAGIYGTKQRNIHNAYLHEIKLVFFLFVDYIGGDSGACKSAKHEIRSLQSLIECNISHLFFPLMCIVDYLGLRLVCTSLISGIGLHSLKYGSADAGRNIYCDDVRLNTKIRQACEMLNIQGHNVIVNKNNDQNNCIVCVYVSIICFCCMFRVRKVLHN